MDIKELIRKELKFAEREFQLKLKATIPEEEIIRLGAKRLGSVIHEDKFYVKRGCHISGSNELVRIRKAGGEDLIFTYRGPVAHRKIRNQLIVNRKITKKELEELLEDYEEIISVNKKRTLFLLGKVLINLDNVEHMGEFIEFDVDTEKESYLISGIINKLGLNPDDAIRYSYFELALMNMKPVDRIFAKIYEHFGKMSYGISSAVLTTLGIMVGLDSSTQSKVAVVAGITAIAVSDSMSDAMGIYTAKKAERGTTESAAMKNAISVYLTKLAFTLSFLVPFIFLPIQSAIFVSLVWGLMLLSFVSAQIAFVQEESIPKSVGKNLLMATVIIVLAYVFGQVIAFFSA